MTRFIARRYLFEGQVQGVGFRRTAESIARGFAVTGYVMNRSDGSVEIHIEGSIEAIDDFIEELDQRFEGQIARVSQQLSEQLNYRTFAVAFEPAQVGV